MFEDEFRQLLAFSCRMERPKSEERSEVKGEE